MRGNHYLYQRGRGGVWYFVRRVPSDLVGQFSEVIKVSLKTHSLREARIARDNLAQKYTAEFEASRGGHSYSGPAAPGVTVPDIERMVRKYVDDRLQRARTRALEFGPPDDTQALELHNEASEVLSWLRKPECGQAQEMISSASAAAYGGSDEGSSHEAMATSLVLRGLVEIQRQKLASLQARHDAPAFDPFFSANNKPTVTFGDLARQFLQKRIAEDKVAGIKQKTTDKWKARTSLMTNLVGADTPASALTYDFCLEVRDLLAKVPSNLVKLFKDLPLKEAIRQGEQRGLATLSATTQLDYWATYQGILNLAVDKGLLEANRATRIAPLVRETVSAEDKVISFTEPQIRQLFSSAFYASVADAKYKELEPAIRGWRFWVPLLCLFHGLRGREAVQLLGVDLQRTDSGTWFLNITDKGEGAELKSVKTIGSNRRVPLHPELLKIGFVEFVKKHSNFKAVRIFGELTETKYGDPAQYVLRRLREAYLPKAFKMLPGQNFHSFRHTYRDAIRRAELPDHVLRVVGWTVPKSVSDNYGSLQDDPDMMLKYTSQISYPGVDLSALYGRGGAL